MTIIPLSPDSGEVPATLQTAGGKGANLVRLARAGFPVPGGFIVSTDAYRAFVEANGLKETISEAIAGLDPEDTKRLERTSAAIRSAYAAGNMPAPTEQAIRQAYDALNGAAVAVRSSATAEDLPDLSFAGQQDTYLNVVGTAEVLKAVVACWSSLWTARAIGYRTRNGIGHEEAALAVVVQEMVQSDVSGVLFTANPLTGLLSESVIDATFGLGEALVSGQVEPDSYVVDSRNGGVQQATLGAKAVTTRGKAGGGVETVEGTGEARPALADGQIREVVALGQQVQEEYQAPQDIEWAIANGRLYLLQSRPITSLFPVPEISFDPLLVWLSFGAIQGVVGPITPLGCDAIRHVVAGAGRMFGLRPRPEEQRLFVTAGERIWVKLSDLIRHPMGARIFDGALGYIDPSARQILISLAADPQLGTGRGRFRLSTLRRLAGFFIPIAARFAGNLLRPERGRARFDAAIEAYLAEAKIPEAADRYERLANVVGFMRQRISDAFPFLLPRFIPLFGPSMGALTLLNKIAGEERTLALEVTRGLPDNVTTEMDLALWETAKAIVADGESARIFGDSEANALAGRYLRGELPAAAQAAVGRFMERYGVRGVGEIDLGRPRWREDPTPVMQTLQSYLQIEPGSAPDVLFTRGEAAAEAAIEKLVISARSQRGGRIKARMVRAAARRIRVLMGARESPKFAIVRIMGVARSALLVAGREFVEAGTLDRPDDLAFLSLSELEALSRQEPGEWQPTIAERRAVYERETKRRQVPRILVSDGRAFYEGLGAESDTGEAISGSPVSPGVAEGVVRVVLDPRTTRLAPGEILVCPGTDPAWTPLFMAAAGLVTEVGGMMTHGSVVAREYGIPAVVGVHQATTRLKDGQRIRLDGTAGKIVVLDP